MWWKLKRSDFMRQRGEANRKALKKIVDSGKVPGILAYADSEPVGWCAVSPREAYPAWKGLLFGNELTMNLFGQLCAFLLPNHLEAKD